MSIDINKHETDIDILKKQNVYDFTSIKEIYRKIENINNEISLLKRKGQIFNKINDNNTLKEVKEVKEEINSLILEFAAIRNNISKAIFIEPVTQQSIPCTNISLNLNSLSFISFNQQTLVVNVSPSNTTDSIIWNSSNNNVASVNNGVVTAIGNGNCTITVSCGTQTTSCNINVSVTSSVTNYSITNNLTNVSNSNSLTMISESSIYEATLSPISGYTLSTVKITMNGNDITVSSYSNGKINISNVTGNIVITAAATEIVTDVTNYSITNNLTNVSNSNSASNINEKSSYSATLTASDDYELSTVKITMGGKDITASSYSNGKINISNVTGNIVITATATEKIADVVEFTPFGNFAIGQLSSSSASNLTTTYKQAVSCINTGKLKSGSVIGFNDSSLYSTYKFAYGLKTGTWINGSNGAYHTQNVTISDVGEYGIMVLKTQSADFTEDELTKINTSFGKLPTV